MTLFGLDEGGEEMRIEGGSETIKTCRFDSLLRELFLDPNGSEKRPLTLPEATYYVHTDVLRY